MAPTKFDWSYLRENTLVPGVTLLVAAILLALSGWFYLQQEARFTIYSSNHEAVFDDYDALVYRRKLLERHHRRYQELQDAGFVGHENRLDWVQTIRGTAQDLDLPNVSYSLEPQKAAMQPVPSLSSSADIQIFLSRVQFELGLVHELDLLRFFARLELDAPGLMKVDSCALFRDLDLSRSLVAEANIVARCSLDMFSVVTSDISLAANGAGT